MTAREEKSPAQPEQLSLLRSGGSDSLNEQVAYNTIGSSLLLPGTGEPINSDDDDDDDTDQDGNDTDNDLGGIMEVLKQQEPLSIWDIICILSTAFSYGCILTTLFLITLPVECERIQHEHPEIAKSVALGNFVAIAGVTQLIFPLLVVSVIPSNHPHPTILGNDCLFLCWDLF